MFNAAMQEHMCDQLVRFEIHRTNIVKSQPVFKMYLLTVLKSDLRQEHQHIYNHQILYNRWKGIGSVVSEIAHPIFFLTEQHFQYGAYAETCPLAVLW